MKTCVVTMLRNPNIDDLLEWICYHLVIGFDKVIIYDHNRKVTEGRTGGHSDNLEEIKQALSKLISLNLVEFNTQLHGFDPKQCFLAQQAYKNAQKHYKNEFTWAAFLDHDEFIFSPKSHSIVHFLSMLSRFRHIGCVMLQHRNFGSAGHDQRPEGFVIENYLLREKEWGLSDIKDPDELRELIYKGNKRKTILKLEAGDKPLFGTHSWSLLEGYERFSLDIENWRINHYHTKSREDYAEKMKLGTPHGFAQHVNWEHFNTYQLKPVASREQGTKRKELVYDDSMLPHLEKIKNFMAKVAVN